MSTTTSPMSTMNISSTGNSFKVEMKVNIVFDGIAPELINDFVNAHTAIQGAILAAAKENIPSAILVKNMAQVINMSDECAAQAIAIVRDACNLYGESERLNMVKYVREKTGLSLKQSKDAVDTVYPMKKY